MLDGTSTLSRAWTLSTSTSGPCKVVSNRDGIWWHLPTLSNEPIWVHVSRLVATY